MTLKDFVINYRKEHNLSQRQFALQCGLSNGYISMIEREKNPKTGEKITPTLTALNKIATGMNMSLNDLFISVDDMEVNIEKPASNSEGELNDIDIEIISLLADLSPESKEQAVSFLRFLAANEGK